MKILVCVKQVPESLDAVAVDPKSGRIRTDPSASYKMNPFDEYALELGLRIREASDGALDAVSVGPDRAAVVVKRALGMGADHGIHILDRQQEAGEDPFRTARLIARCAMERGYDLILGGMLSEDEMQGAVGPMIAELLSIPWATGAVKAALSPGGGTVRVERELEAGAREALELRLPALLTVQSGINRPRYPSLSNMLRARGQRLDTREAVSLKPPLVRQAEVRTVYPEKSRSATVLQGTPEEKAECLIRLLEERLLIRPPESP